MKTEKVLGTIVTMIAVGAASTAGAALWTKVLEKRFRTAKERIMLPDDSNVIDFRKAKKRMSR